MDGLQFQVSITCLLLKMTFDPSTGQHLGKLIGCPMCPEGYFVMKNCSVTTQRSIGVQCKACTSCSAAHQDTLVECSSFADSLCGNRTTPVVTATPTEPPVSPPEVWIVLTLIFISLILVLLGWLLTLLLCRQCNKLKDLDPL